MEHQHAAITRAEEWDCDTWLRECLASVDLEIEVVDVGIGAYEFCGARGFDSEKVALVTAHGEFSHEIILGAGNSPTIDCTLFADVLALLSGVDIIYPRDKKFRITSRKESDLRYEHRVFAVGYEYDNYEYEVGAKLSAVEFRTETINGRWALIVAVIFDWGDAGSL